MSLGELLKAVTDNPKRRPSRLASPFAYVAVPVAIVLSLLRFNIIESAIVVGACIIGATLMLIFELSRYRGWSMIYNVLGGDVHNAFWQWPPIWLDVLVPAVASDLPGG